MEPASAAVVAVCTEQHGTGRAGLDASDTAGASAAAAGDLQRRLPAAAAPRRITATSPPVPPPTTTTVNHQTRRGAASLVRLAAISHRTQAQRPQGSTAPSRFFYRFCYERDVRLSVCNVGGITSCNRRWKMGEAT